MAQYIDKAALVAEIEKQQRRLDILGQANKVELRKTAAIQNGVYCTLLSFIDTLEVKEVDLKKEIDLYIENSITGINPIYTKGAVSNLVEKTAQHFFELGLNVQKGE